MASAEMHTSSVILQEVVVAGASMRVLIDSGATTSCCSKRWCQKYHIEMGPLMHDQTQVIGMENTPIFVDGRTVRLPLVWKEATTTVSFLVVPTLIEPDVIPSMNLLQRLGVKIDAKVGVAEPTVLVLYVQPLDTLRTTAMKSMVFPIRNPFPERKNNKILFEPSNKLLSALRGTTSLGRGEKIYVRFENVSEEEQVLNPDWEIGTMEVVEEEPDFPQAETEGAGLPPTPNELSAKQRKELGELLEEFKDVFTGKDFKLGNTDLIEHKIHTKGPPIRQPHKRQNPEVRKHELEQLKEMLDQEIVRPSCSLWASPVVMVKKKKRRYSKVLYRF